MEQHLDLSDERTNPRQDGEGKSKGPRKSPRENQVRPSHRAADTTWGSKACRRLAEHHCGSSQRYDQQAGPQRAGLRGRLETSGRSRTRSTRVSGREQDCGWWSANTQQSRRSDQARVGEVLEGLPEPRQSRTVYTGWKGEKVLCPGRRRSTSSTRTRCT